MANIELDKLPLDKIKALIYDSTRNVQVLEAELRRRENAPVAPPKTVANAKSAAPKKGDDTTK